MHDRPRFTLLMGSYNHSRFVPESMDGVLAQTLPPDRIVYFDDGSRDGSYDLVRARLGDDTRVVWVDDPRRNMGLLARMLLSREHILPDSYVVQHATDDILTPSCFAIHADAIVRTGTRWSVAEAEEIDEESSAHLRRLTATAAVREGDTPLLKQLLETAPFPPVHAWAYARSLLDQVGGFDPDFAMEDLPLLFRFAAVERPTFSEGIVQRVRVRPNQYGRWKGQIPRDAARLALEFLKAHPKAALHYASRQYFGAAIGEARAGQWVKAAVDLTRAVALWPVPTAPHYRLVLEKLGKDLLG